MKVVHLNQDSRASFGITQGLLALDLDVHMLNDYFSGGELVKRSSENIKKHIQDCDVILMNDFMCFGEFLVDKKLIGKIVFYDYRDSTTIASGTERIATYFKRSLFRGPARIPVEFKRTVIPITHCALAEYYRPARERRFNIGCFFDISNPNLGCRRRITLQTLLSADFDNSLIGVSTCRGQEARMALQDNPVGNRFYDFLDLQSQCRIVFTAQPEHVDGDNRTWEAFASGAMVCCDRSYIPTKFPLIDGLHCLVFDAMDEKSIRNTIEKARFYLSHEEERSKIAAAGLMHVNAHHRPVNRARMLLNAHFGKKMI